MWWNKITSTVTVIVLSFAVASLFSNNPHAFLNGILIGVAMVLGIQISIMLKNPVLYTEVLRLIGLTNMDIQWEQLEKDK